MNSPKIDQCIEALCLKGCTEVLQVISTLERGESVPEANDLDHQERQAVLAELKAIMAVYDN